MQYNGSYYSEIKKSSRFDLHDIMVSCKCQDKHGMIVKKWLDNHTKDI